MDTGDYFTRAAAPWRAQPTGLYQAAIGDSTEAKAQSESRSPWLPSISLTEVPEAQSSNAVKPNDASPVSPQSSAADAQPASPLDLFRSANEQLSKSGMTAETKQKFQNAIAVADNLLTPQMKEMEQTLARVLMTGQKLDGTQLTTAEKLQAHDALNQYFKAEALPIQMRLSYSQMLNDARQFGSAQTVFKESIAKADTLPIEAMKQEASNLSRDMSDPSIPRTNQAGLSALLHDTIGDHSAEHPGFLYLPVLARLQTAEFYVGRKVGPGGTLEGAVLKPGLANEQLQAARGAFQKSYGTELKDGSDPFFDMTKANVDQYQPEALKKHKDGVLGDMTGGVVDLVAGAVGITVAGAAASLLLENPACLEEALGVDAKLLGIGSKVVGTAAGIGASAVTRHYSQEIVGNHSEDWTKSFIHGTAGLAEVYALTRGKAATENVLFTGATEEGALARMAAERGGNVQMSELQQLYKANKWKLPEALSSAEPNAFAVQNGQVVNDFSLGLTPSQSAKLAELSLPRTWGGWLSKATGKYVPRFGALDLTTASGANLASRSYYSGFIPTIGAVEGYNVFASADAPVDPKTGQPMSYLQNLENNTFSANTFFDTLILRHSLQAGSFAKDMTGSNIWSKGWNFLRSAHVPENESLWKPFAAAGVGLQANSKWTPLVSDIGALVRDNQSMNLEQEQQ